MHCVSLKDIQWVVSSGQLGGDIIKYWIDMVKHFSSSNYGKLWFEKQKTGHSDPANIYLWTYFTAFSSVSIFDFEQVGNRWEKRYSNYSFEEGVGSWSTMNHRMGDKIHPLPLDIGYKLNVQKTSRTFSERRKYVHFKSCFHWVVSYDSLKCEMNFQKSVWKCKQSGCR